MPGVVEMEAAQPSSHQQQQNGVMHTNHDRDPRVNGVSNSGTVSVVNGNPTPPSQELPFLEREKDKGRMPSVGGINGAAAIVNGDGQEDAGDGDKAPKTEHANVDEEIRSLKTTDPSRMNDLPDEILHITHGFVPLNLLLSRLAQVTHNALQDKVMALAKMPVPAAAGVNGNAAHAAANAALDDISQANLTKKALLLTFAQEWHAKWVKALVITDWSRRSDQVSKLIDLKSHLDLQRRRYDDALMRLIDVKRGLIQARLPNPDLKTALQALSTGDVPWMPELEFIDPPEVTSEEQTEWIDNLNTLLSVRLNIEDHDIIPYHFRQYSIDDGRVTFTVDGEFEVDLTIGDEDLEKQFWFIDFRFLFAPIPADMSKAMRTFMESRVNDVLEKEGLLGCYRFLHEFVLTHKISELLRQAHSLRRNRWAENLKIERLNRAMAIQYWTTRYPPNGPRSWIIIGVSSSKDKDGVSPDPANTSHLSLRWFRDSKEVDDVWIDLDSDEVSAETVLKLVIAQHVGHYLSAIHDKLKSKPRYVRRETALKLHVSETEPSDSYLEVQLWSEASMRLKIDPVTGFFALTLHSRLSMQLEQRLNFQGLRDVADEAVDMLETTRFQVYGTEMGNRAKSMGWSVHASPRGPMKVDEVKLLLGYKENFGLVWFKRQGWDQKWYLMCHVSLSGDTWWLMEMLSTSPAIATPYRLPLGSGQPDLTDAFFGNLSTFASGMIAQITDLQELHRRHIYHKTGDLANWSLPSQIRIPAIHIQLSHLLSMHNAQPLFFASQPSWAKDFVSVSIKGIYPPGKLPVLPAPDTGAVLMDSPSARRTGGDNSNNFAAQAAAAADDGGDQSHERLRVAVVAQVRVTDLNRFRFLGDNKDPDVAFHEPSGVLALRIWTDLGESVLEPLMLRLRAVDRIAAFVSALRKQDHHHQQHHFPQQTGDDTAKPPPSAYACELATLHRLVFRYGDFSPNPWSSSSVLAGGLVLDDRNGIPLGNERDALRYRAVLDVSDPSRPTLHLGADNPHLRVLDHMRRLLLMGTPDAAPSLSSASASPSEGFAALPHWLALTQPLLRALQAVETAWEPMQMAGQGSVQIYPRSLEWYLIRYTLPARNPARQHGHAAAHTRRLGINIRLRPRRGDMWWHVSRARIPAPAKAASKKSEAKKAAGARKAAAAAAAVAAAAAAAAASADNAGVGADGAQADPASATTTTTTSGLTTLPTPHPSSQYPHPSMAPHRHNPDDLDALLGPVWSDGGDGWKGLATGAAARPELGIELLLAALDDVLRSHAAGPAARHLQPDLLARPLVGGVDTPPEHTTAPAAGADAYGDHTRGPYAHADPLDLSAATAQVGIDGLDPGAGDMAMHDDHDGLDGGGAHQPTDDAQGMMSSLLSDEATMMEGLVHDDDAHALGGEI